MKYVGKKYLSYTRRIMIRYLATFVTVFFFTGCATRPIKLSDNARRSIKTVSFSKEIRFAQRMWIQSPPMMAPFGGCIGGAITGAVAGYQGGKAAKHRKTMDEITREYISNSLSVQFVEKLEKTGLFRLIEPTPEKQPDAEFVLIVGTYGFGQPIPFTWGKRKPILNVEARLILNPPFEVDGYSLKVKNPADHPMVWFKSAHVVFKGKYLPAHKLETYTNNPEKIREAFEKSCEIIVDELVRHLENIDK